MSLPDNLLRISKPLTQEELDEIKARFEHPVANAFKLFTNSVQETFVQMVPIIGKVFRNIRDALARAYCATLPMTRSEYGGNGTDAVMYPDEWVSAVCGAWLCKAGGDTCPSGEYKLGCHCSCHGGSRS